VVFNAGSAMLRFHGLIDHESSLPFSLELVSPSLVLFVKAQEDNMSNEDAIRDASHSKWEAEGRPEGSHDRHWPEAKKEIGGNATGAAQTWSGDHHGGVSPPTSTGSVEDEQVQEPSNDWPAAASPSDTEISVPSPVDKFDPPDAARRTFGNGDTDRS
jgi:hypothetical protein